jgi:mono/diheme cytochrome c family protein
MREQWARRIAFLTGLLILLLAIVFAISQNPEKSTGTDTAAEQLPSTGVVEAVDLDPQRVDAGRQVYQQQACARCHSIAGEGSKNSPLDGVGGRRNADELHDWVVGADNLQGVLPDRAFNQKQAHKELPADDLDALVIYMQSLRPELPGTSGEQPPAVEADDLDPQRVDAGRQIYQELACERCHSIAGEGNENSPLDGVGGRRDEEELRDWIVGADNLQGVIPDRAFSLKQVHKELPAEDLDALVIYMQSLHP